MKYAISCPFSKTLCDSRCNHHYDTDPPYPCVRAVAKREEQKRLRAAGLDPSGVRADLLDHYIADKRIIPD